MKQLLYGVAYYFEYLAYDRIDKDISMMQDAGINVVRIGESTWSTYEPQDGLFDFTKLTYVLDKMKAAGMNVILPQYYQIREFNRINTMCLQTLLLIRGNYYTEALPSYAITELMLEIINDFITGLQHLTRANPKATEIIDWLSSHLDADLTVRGLADHFEMNYRYVSRLIKKETGMTASRLILQKKLDIACGLLLKSNLPLKLIVDQSYFNDEKYFLRCFKKQLGQMPTQYRQQYMDDFLLNDTRTREARR